MLVSLVLFFFVKQKTAYEMRISDWSSDVCSSDLLKKDGISVVDSLNSESTTNHSGREMTAITNIFQDKLEDMDEGSARSFNNILWKDGTQSSKVFAGIQSIIVDDPTTGVAAGIDRATNTWRSEEHTSELQSLMRISYAVFCL